MADNNIEQDAAWRMESFYDFDRFPLVTLLHPSNRHRIAASDAFRSPLRILEGWQRGMLTLGTREVSRAFLHRVLIDRFERASHVSVRMEPRSTHRPSKPSEHKLEFCDWDRQQYQLYMTPTAWGLVWREIMSGQKVRLAVDSRGFTVSDPLASLEIDHLTGFQLLDVFFAYLITKGAETLPTRNSTSEIRLAIDALRSNHRFVPAGSTRVGLKTEFDVDGAFSLECMPGPDQALPDHPVSD